MDIETFLSYKIYSELLNSNSLILDFPSIKHGKPWPRKPYDDVAGGPGFDCVPYVEGKYNTKLFVPDYPFPEYLCILEYKDWLEVQNKKIFINHSYEPVEFENDKFFWNQNVFSPRDLFCNPNKDTNDQVFLLHSEKNSKDVELAIENVSPRMEIKPVHWCANGYVCAEYWYKNFGIKMFDDWRRPIKHKYLCMSRQFNSTRKYRLEFLNIIDTTQGCYSLLERCPETGMTPNDVLPSNTVTPYSFDEHGNDSAYIEMRFETPVNTSFLHVVMETVFDSCKQHFTEKTFKPIVLQQPFVLVGSAHILKHLRSYGFQTFEQWWDESYDSIEDPQERLHACAKIVNDIAAMDIADLYELREKMSSVLEHNRRHFYTQFSDIVWKELGSNLSAVL